MISRPPSSVTTASVSAATPSRHPGLPWSAKTGTPSARPHSAKHSLRPSAVVTNWVLRSTMPQSGTWRWAPGHGPCATRMLPGPPDRAREGLLAQQTKRPRPMAGVPADRLITGVAYVATHVSPMSRLKTWRARRDSNPRPSDPKSDALSTELRARSGKIIPGPRARVGRARAPPARALRRGSGAVAAAAELAPHGGAAVGG